MGPGRAVSLAESSPAGVEEQQALPGERDPRCGSRLVAAALLPQQAKLSTLKHTEKHTRTAGAAAAAAHSPHTHTH